MSSSYAIGKIEEYWDERAGTFDQDHDTEKIEEWENTLKKLLGKDTNKNVLDLGTGTGFLANMTANIGFATIGADLSTEMMRYGVRHAKRKGSNAIFMQANALDLPFMDNTIDYITNSRLIWTLVQPDLAIKEWIRVLKPGGKIFCFNRMEEGVGLTTKPGVYNDDAVEKELSIRDAKMSELIELLRRNGMEGVFIEKLPGLTREEFDYEPWFVLTGTKAIKRRDVEAEGIADFWDISAKDYEETHEIANKDVWQKILQNYIGDNKEKKILDIATGTGIIANMLGQAGYKNVVGGDLSEGMMKIAIQHAKETNSGVNFKYANAMELPFEDNSLDVVINSRLLWTLTEPEAALKEWKRVLKPGGMVIAINEVEPDGIKCGNIDKYKADIKAQEIPYANVEQQEILDLFERIGFKNITMDKMEGCHLLNSDVENWFAFIGKKEEEKNEN